jgi:hypothetical protein
VEKLIVGSGNKVSKLNFLNGYNNKSDANAAKK